MLDVIAAIVSAPILLAQGLWVRRTMEKLPEALGYRQGEVGTGELLRIVLVGDSAAAGVGVTHIHESLIGHLTGRLATKYRVSWQVIATSGHKTKDVLQVLHQRMFEQADYVITSVGANDVTGSTWRKNWLQQQKELHALILKRFNPRTIVVSHVPPMHLFSALPRPLRWYLGFKSWYFNAGLQSLARVHPSIQCIAFRLPTNTPSAHIYLAKDGFHPSHVAYAQWAELIAQHILLKTQDDSLETLESK